MLDDEKGHALAVECGHPVDDLVQQRRVDAGTGLVQQHQLGLGHHHAGQFQQLALAARQHPGRFGRQCRQAHEVQPVSRGGLYRPLLLRHGARAQPVGPEALAQLAPGCEHHVVQHRHLGEGARDLEGAGEACGENAVRRGAGDVAAIQLHLPGRGLERAGQAVEQRGLARAIGPDQAANGPAGKGKREGVDGPVAAKAFGNLPRSQKAVILHGGAQNNRGFT